MFEIAPARLFSSTFVVRTPQHELVELRMRAFRERAEFLLQGRTYSLYREGGMSGDFVIEQGGRLHARAQKPSAFRNRFELTVADKRFELRRAGVFKRRFEIVFQDRPVGSVERVRAWGRTTRVDLPSDWSMPVQLFVFWLAALMWNRQDAAAAGG